MKKLGLICLAMVAFVAIISSSQNAQAGGGMKGVIIDLVGRSEP